MPNRSNQNLPAVFVDTPPSPPVSQGTDIPPALLEVYDVTYLHFHRYIELGLCVSGSGICYVENEMQRFSAGDVQIIFPFQQHLSKSTGKEPCLWYWDFIDLSQTMAAAGMMDVQEIEHWTKSEMPFCGIVDREAYPSLCALIHSLVEQTCCPSGAAAHPQAGYAVDVIQMVLQMCNISKQTGRSLKFRNGSSLADVRPALDCIKEKMECSEVPTVNELSDICGMSVANFRRLFHRAIGMPPKDYMTACAIRKARMLLVTTDRKIVDIACAVGFRNISGFNRCFLKEMQISPSAYRRQYQK